MESGEKAVLLLETMHITGLPSVISKDYSLGKLTQTEITAASAIPMLRKKE